MNNNYIPTQEDISKQNELIGDFIVRFEQVNGFIRFAIHEYFFKNPNEKSIKIIWDAHARNSIKKKIEVINQLKILPELQASKNQLTLNKLTENWNNLFVEIFLEGLTAHDTRNIFQSLLTEHFTTHFALIQVCEKLSEKYKQLSFVRNTIVHGTILLGWNSDYGNLNPDSMLIRQLKIKENFLDTKSLVVSVSHLKMFSYQTLEIYNCYVQISAYLSDSRSNHPNNYTSYIINIEKHLKNIGINDFSE